MVWNVVHNQAALRSLENSQKIQHDDCSAFFIDVSGRDGGLTLLPEVQFCPFCGKSKNEQKQLEYFEFLDHFSDENSSYLNIEPSLQKLECTGKVVYEDEKMVHVAILSGQEEKYDGTVLNSGHFYIMKIIKAAIIKRKVLTVR